MAKSIRSKTKRAFRQVKRQSGVFAAADAARLHRLSSKLRAKLGSDQEGDVTLPEASEEAVAEDRETVAENLTHTAAAGVMELDNSTPKKISTSGRHLSRRESWRLSKGMRIHKKDPNKVNRFGVVAAKRRAGRPNRRR